MSQERPHQPSADLDVLVSGGSMGGLCTGIALLQAGHAPTVHERSTAELESRGGGIVAQKTVREFLARRTDTAPEEITTTTSERRFLTDDGGIERSRRESMVFTSWDALYRRLRDVFPDDRYQMGDTVVDVTPETATATFDDGTERTADVVVAAEGGQSSTRRDLFPDADPVFADYVAYRGLVPEADLPDATAETFDDAFVFYQGAGQLVLAYFIPGPKGGTEPEARRLNWVWYDSLDGADRRTVFTDSTGAERRFTVPPGRLRDSIRDEREERATTLPPAFRSAVERTADLFVQAIYDRTVPDMVTERVCLLGDAAFVARPHTAAGTAKAVGDAVALEEALDSHESLDSALASWSRTRTAYGTRLVERGKRMGEDRLGLGSIR